MTNLKKLGLTALAGSLVATTGYAGELGVSGTAKASYNSGDTISVTGNPYSMSTAITFSGAGELDNGMNIALTMVTDTASTAFSSSSLVLDMGDAGSLALLNGMNGGYGAAAYKDKMPSAGEEVYDDMSGEANGILSMDNGNTLAYKNSVSGVNFSVDFNADNGSDGSSKSIGLDYSPMDGMMVFVGQSDIAAGTNDTDTHTTFGGTYTTMGATVGIQMTSIDDATAASDIDRTHIAASFAVNENLSVSYGISNVSFEAASKTDQEDSGLGASYTMGSMSFGASLLASDNVGGTSGTDDTHKELSVAFAF
jgi:outer membrane protein OmpU|tara:strand:- start:16 stop:945 length:930 start_codon:yes stop_codon:yes gene_type:complete